MLSQLPIVDLGFHKGLYTVGSRVLQLWHTKMSRIPFIAYLVQYNVVQQETLLHCWQKLQ